MRVLIVRPGPHFSVQDVCNGWVRGLRNAGADVGDFNFDRRLDFYATVGRMAQNGEFIKSFDDTAAVHHALRGITSACFEWWPHVVLVVSGFYTPTDILDLIRARGMTVVIMFTESPYEDSRQMRLAEHADAVIANDIVSMPKFAEICPTAYFGHRWDPTIHCRRPVRPELVSDVCFVGTGYKSRIEFFEQMDWSGIDLLLAGNWQHLSESSPLRKYVAHPIGECVENDEAMNAYSAARIGINLYRQEVTEDTDTAAGISMSPREVEMAAVGLPFARQPREEGDHLLGMLPTFENPAEAESVLRWMLTHPDECSEMASKARMAVSDLTFDAAAREFLGWVESIPRRNV